MPNDQSRHIFFSNPGETFAVGFTPAEFEEKTGVIYLSHLEFDSYAVLTRVKKQSRKEIRYPYISPSVKWLGTFFAKELESGFVNDVVIRWIDDRIGFGVFARRDFSKGEFIGEYTGVVKRSHFFKSNINLFCFHYPVINQFINVHTIDAEQKGNETRFINHSLSPNCEPFVCYHEGLLHVCIRTKERISKGEELTYQFTTGWWKDRIAQTM